MSVIGSEDMANAGGWDDEALKILDGLDAANEQFMLVNIELRDLLEEAVTREVGLEKRVDGLVPEIDNLRVQRDSLTAQRDAARAENGDLRREVADLRAQLDRVDAELTALHNTKLMRAAAPFRSLYARVRRPHG